MITAICRRCREPIPDKLISCPRCAGELNREAMRRYQFDPLLKLADGKGAFTIHRTPSGDHAQRYGPKGMDAHAFCGAEANAGKNKRYYIAYGVAVYLAQVCAKCQAAIAELLGEAREAEAIREA